MRHAIFLVFEYLNNSLKAGSLTPLLGMEIDIDKAFEMSTTMFGIPRENITILTDVSAGKLAHLEGVVLKHYDHPDILQLLPELYRTINRIKLLEHTKNPQLFVYYSGHGICLPSGGDEQATFLILTDSLGQERNYLSRREMAAFFYTGYRPDELGLIHLPISKRHTKVGKYTTIHSYLPEQVSIDVGMDYAETDSQFNTFFLYDACHSGSLSGLKYHFTGKDFVLLHNDHDEELPFSVGVGATNDSQEAPSCSQGSPFTSHIHSVFNGNDWLNEPFTVRSLYSKINSKLHKLLRKKCSPTVTASHPHPDVPLPVINCQDFDPSKKKHRKTGSMSWRLVFKEE